MLPPDNASECRTLLPVIPTFLRIRDDTKSSQRLSADRLDHLAGNEVEDVVVCVRASEARRRAAGNAAAGRFLCGRRSRRPPQQIARAESEPAAVHQQVAHGDLARDVRIRHLEPRQVR